MNKVVLLGRLTRNPEVRYSAGENSLAIGRYTLAVDRRFKKDGEAAADFIGCVVFGKSAEFAESKNLSGQHNNPAAPNNSVGNDGFMNITDGIDEELPFNKIR